MKKILFLTLSLSLIYSCSAPTPVTNADLDSLKGVFNDYKNYTKINDKLIKSPTHGGKYVFTYINNKGIDSFRNKKFPFSYGTISVKEAHGNDDPNSNIDTLFVMKKIEGFDKDNGDWYYSMLDPKGNPQQGGGKISMCINCHRGAKDKDYIFGF